MTPILLAFTPILAAAGPAFLVWLFGGGFGLALVCDLRIGAADAKYGANFVKLGLAPGMAISYLLPRLVGVARASELLYTGRALGGEEAAQWGFLNRVCAPETVLADALALANDIARGPTFANGITKTMLHQEWAMTIEQAIEAEAQAQAICMLTEDFNRAYQAFSAKSRPVFEGN